MGGIVTEAGPGQFLGGQQGTGAGAGLLSFAVNLISGISFKAIRDRAKAKKALAIANAGGYDTLTPYQKSLISSNVGGGYSATPEKAALKLDLMSVVIFFALGVILFLIFRPERSRY